jgi:hypothetical protein
MLVITFQRCRHMVNVSKSAQPFVDFGLHVIFGGMCFVLLFSVTVGLNLMVRWCEARNWGAQIIFDSMDYVEFILFAIDVCFLSLFLVVMAARFIGEVVKQTP